MANTRPTFRPTRSGSGRPSIALRAPGQAVATMAAVKGAATKRPMIGKGLASAAQPTALPAVAMPTHRPSRAAMTILVSRDASRKTSRVLMTKTISAAVATVPRKSSMRGPPIRLPKGRVPLKMFNIIFMEDAMPYSATHKRQTRQRILESARRLFNSKGFTQVSIGEVMENAGLTHGGFYRHFKDKDELYAEAVRWFLCEEAPKPWRRPRRNAHKLRAERIVDAYFSRDHFDDRESCCPLIALPFDIARSGDGVKAAYQDVLEKLLGLLQADLAGPQARERALSVAALCVGGLVTARGVTDPGLAQELRQAAYRQAQTMLIARPC
ncbi:MAG: TetR family transcriptional regulator [Rhodospirillales bacterium]|nr:TetR family transcriptional regulator [Rhodospirillales bacterium]